MAKKTAPTPPGVPIDRSARIERGERVLNLIAKRVTAKGRSKESDRSPIGPGPSVVTPRTLAKYRTEAIWQVVQEVEGVTATDVEVDTQMAELIRRICPEPKFANTTQRTLIDAVTSGRLPLTRESLERLYQLPPSQLTEALKKTLAEQI